MSKRVLTVDDSPSVRQMVAATLRSAGYDVLEAADGREALALAQHAPVELVLTDHNMPSMDGLMLIRALRASVHGALVPIVMLTTESSDEMKAQGRAAGATGWMTKPFDPARLLEVVRKVIG